MTQVGIDADTAQSARVVEANRGRAVLAGEQSQSVPLGPVKSACVLELFDPSLTIDNNAPRHSEVKSDRWSVSIDEHNFPGSSDSDNPRAGHKVSK